MNRGTLASSGPVVSSWANVIVVNPVSGKVYAHVTWRNVDKCRSRKFPAGAKIARWWPDYRIWDIADRRELSIHDPTIQGSKAGDRFPLLVEPRSR